jgi:hypothetical protein
MARPDKPTPQIEQSPRPGVRILWCILENFSYG